MVSTERSSELDARWRHRPPERMPDRFGHVSSSPDQGQLARQAIVRLQQLLTADANNAEILGPFLDGIGDLVEQAWPTDATRTRQPEPDDEEAHVTVLEAAEALVVEVEQLEDLLEALRAVR